MYLVQIFGTSPLMALALCVCLATILWCIFLTRRQTNRLDKLLAGVLGLIAIYEALRVLKDAGIVSFSAFRRLDGWAEFLIATLYFLAALMLKLSSMDRASTKVRLRLVEANEKLTEMGKSSTSLPPDLAYILFDSSPMAIFACDSSDTVIYWNPAAEELLGWSRMERLGHPLPFDANGPFVDKLGREVEAAVWTAPVGFSSGSRRATLTMLASSSALGSTAARASTSPFQSELVLHP